jgi:hypothetical protein
VPAPTPWPIVLAFGIALLFAGLVTSEAVSVLGAVVAIAGAVGWFRDVLPHEAHESVQVIAQVPDVTTMRREVARMEVAHELAARMAAVRDLSDFGWNQGRSGWKRGHGGPGDALRRSEPYEHLVSDQSLAAGFFPAAATDTTAEIAAFHLRAFLSRFRFT